MNPRKSIETSTILENLAAENDNNESEESSCNNVQIEDLFPIKSETMVSNFELNYLLMKLEKFNETKTPDTRMAFFKYKAELKNEFYTANKKYE